MLNLYVKNTVKDFDTWMAVFQEETANSTAAGLSVVYIWRDPDDEHVVYFLLRVEDRAKADAYMTSPESSAVGERAGVTGGEIQYLETA